MNVLTIHGERSLGVFAIRRFQGQSLSKQQQRQMCNLFTATIGLDQEQRAEQQKEESERQQSESVRNLPPSSGHTLLINAGDACPFCLARQVALLHLTRRIERCQLQRRDPFPKP